MQINKLIASSLRICLRKVAALSEVSHAKFLQFRPPHLNHYYTDLLCCDNVPLFRIKEMRCLQQQPLRKLAVVEKMPQRISQVGPKTPYHDNKGILIPLKVISNLTGGE